MSSVDTGIEECHRRSTFGGRHDPILDVIDHFVLLITAQIRPLQMEGAGSAEFSKAVE